MAIQPERALEWLGSTKKDLTACSDDVKDVFGYALDLAQHDRLHPDAFPMRGNLRGVIEVRADEDGNTYRTMYTAKFGDVIYVLNVFQKKSTQGIKTPQRELDLTEKRLKDAKLHYDKYYKRK